MLRGKRLKLWMKELAEQDGVPRDEVKNWLYRRNIKGELILYNRVTGEEKRIKHESGVLIE